MDLDDNWLYCDEIFDEPYEPLQADYDYTVDVILTLPDGLLVYLPIYGGGNNNEVLPLQEALL